MLARIQNLYLLLVSLLAIASMLLPFWSFDTGQIYIIADFSSATIPDTTYALASTIGMLLSPATALVSFISIFLYKNRNLQRKVILLALLLFLGDLFAGLTAAHFMNEYFKSMQQAATHGPDTGLFILLPEPLLLMLALKGVSKDEKIANAYKRL